VTLTVSAPVPGVVTSMDEVPDPVFSDLLVGPGIAVNPPAGPLDGEITAVAPVSGVVTSLHAHAFVITTNADESDRDSQSFSRAVLVHLGLNTVELQGEGFALHVAPGDRVTVGQELVSWDPNDVEASGRHAICPVIALEADRHRLELIALAGEPVNAGDPLFIWQ